ncbi:MAG: aminopeptidase P family protein [Deltaproteobacteria bacterium]|nr:aminopeptidase P family protein [Deltaproteobacteria bacterium]
MTDPRYITQGELEVEGFKIRGYKKQIEGVISLVRRLRIKRLGFEGKGMSYDYYLGLRKGLSARGLIPVSEGIDRLRAVKDPWEVEAIRKAIRISTKAFDVAKGAIAPGVRERDVTLKVEFDMKAHGAEGVPFDVIVVSGARAALPHGRAASKRIKRGDLVIVDMGATCNGYHSDETSTFVVGKPTRRQREVYQVVKGAHDRAIEGIRPGLKASYIDSIARGVITRAGYGDYFGHGTGHGVGLAVHEAPTISPFGDATLEEGMVFTIEPGVYIPGWGGVRIEDMVLVTSQGCRVLTSMPKEMTIL